MFKKGGIILFETIAAVLVFTSSAYAAQFYFGAPSKEIIDGQTVEIGVFVDTEGQTVNAVEGTVSFDSSQWQWQSANDANSIVNFWVIRPALRGTCAQTCVVQFSGVTPGGYRTDRGQLFSVMLKAKKTGEARLTFSDGRALMNDGSGTSVKMAFAPLSLQVIEGTPPAETASPDIDPPEAFTPIVTRDQNLYDGKWVAIFATRDNGSGIDHYEIQEGHGTEPDSDKWVRAESPVVLSDQNARSTVFIRAIDRAGNARLAMRGAVNALPWYERKIIQLALGMAAIAAITLSESIYRKRKKRARS